MRRDGLKFIEYVNELFLIFADELQESGGTATAPFEEMAGEGVDLGLELVGQFFKEVDVDVEIAGLAGGLDDGFGEAGEAGYVCRGLGGIGEERKLSEDATEDGTELVDGFGFGFAFGENVVEGLAEGGVVAGEWVGGGRHR
jgi:hypothetical protein